MASSSQNSDAPSLDAFRDAHGNLPLVDCKHCGTQMIGLVSKKEHNFGQRFYKCPLINHFYLWEDQYIEYLVGRSKLPRCFSKVSRSLAKASNPKMSSMELIESLKESVGGVQQCAALLDNTATSLKDTEAALKKIVDGNQSMGRSIEKIGDRLFILGVTNLFIVVLLLMVVLVK